MVAVVGSFKRRVDSSKDAPSQPGMFDSNSIRVDPDQLSSIVLMFWVLGILLASAGFIRPEHSLLAPQTTPRT